MIRIQFHDGAFLFDSIFMFRPPNITYMTLFSSRCAVSGSGKIAMHVLEKLIAYGAVPITVSGDFLA